MRIVFIINGADNMLPITMAKILKDGIVVSMAARAFDAFEQKNHRKADHVKRREIYNEIEGRVSVTLP